MFFTGNAFGATYYSNIFLMLTDHNCIACYQSYNSHSVYVWRVHILSVWGIFIILVNIRGQYNSSLQVRFPGCRFYCLWYGETIRFSRSSANLCFCAWLWFPSDPNGIVKSCDPSWFQHITERLITTENKNLTEIASDLQRKRYLS